MALSHIESYTPSPMNMNYNSQDETEEIDSPEHTTTLANVPDYLLNEWATVDQFRPMPEPRETGLGTYCVLEENDPIPNLVKQEEGTNGLWSLFFDGSRTKIGSGAGVVLISPKLERYYFLYRLYFSCTNNVAKYRALIQGLVLAQRRGVQSPKVFGDSELVVNQIRNLNVTKNGLLKSYKHRVWDLIKEFQAFNIQAIPRKQNASADRLAKIGAHYDIP